MKYAIGDRVRIVDSWPKYKAYQNLEGLMDKYLGTVMTIRSVSESVYGLYYKMNEDKHDRAGVGWQWYEAAIAGYAEPDIQSDDFLRMLD